MTQERTSEQTEQSKDSVPIYLPAGEFMGFDDWARLRSLKDQRVRQIISPKIQRDIARLNNPDTTRFLMDATAELAAICQTVFTDQGYRPSAIPVFCLLDSSAGGERYNLNDGGGLHNEATLTAAQLLVEALCPELDIDIKDQWQDLVTKAEAAQKLGYGDVAVNHVSFPTVLPGVTIAFSNHGQDRYVSLGWQVM